MSAASPDDLAVAFRSINRRLHEAEADTPHEHIAAPVAELRGLVHEAASLVGTADDPVAIADAIVEMPADQWDVPTLNRLRAIALDLGRVLRHIAELGGID